MLFRSRTRRLPARFEESEAEPSSLEPPKKRRNTWITKYDAEMVQLSNEGRTDADIAKLLCLRHDADPAKITPRAVESRCRYLKRNGIYKFAPVNSSINLQATDLPRTCISNFFLILSFSNLNFRARCYDYDSTHET